ncbi:MAG TPA: DUF4279 domain-containing protein [Trebonia sp.]
METRASFRLFGDAALTAAAVTRRLGIQPTRALEAGDPVGRHPAATRETSAWLLSPSPGIEVGTEMAERLHRLPRAGDRAIVGPDPRRLRGQLVLLRRLTRH